MKNTTKLLVVFVLMIFISGCASPRIKPAGVEETLYEVEEDKRVSSDHFLYKGISVETEDFLETTRYYMSQKSIPSLNNEDAKLAIERTLDSANLLSSDNSSYLLKATLTDADRGSVFSARTSMRRDIIVNYRLIERESNNVVYDKDITGIGRGNFYIITFNYYGRQREVAEMSFNHNFEQLINDLIEL